MELSPRFGYGYDIDPQTGLPTLLGQRTTLAMTIPSQSLTSATSAYLYDADYELTQASYPSPTPYNGEVDSWTYDAIGNRLTNTVNGSTQTYAYFKNGSNQRNGQRLSSDSVNAYTYDANGNTITRNGTGGNFTFGWDADNRMTSISGAVTASYGYDYQGRRTAKTVSGTTTSYLYDGLNLVRAAGATSTVDYLFGPGIDDPLAVSEGGGVSYFSVEGLGSVSLLTDTAGTAKNSYLYDGWGMIRSQTGTVANDFGYTAREFGEAGLWYYRMRYYQASAGRFLSSDPMPRDDGRGFYAYVVNRPSALVDPTGMVVCEITKQPTFHMVDFSTMYNICPHGLMSHANGCTGPDFYVDCTCKSIHCDLWKPQVEVLLPRVDIWYETERERTEELKHFASYVVLARSLCQSGAALEGQTFSSQPACTKACEDFKRSAAKAIKSDAEFVHSHNPHPGSYY